MESTIYLFAAFSLTWGIIFIYILSMLKRQKSLENRIDTLRTILENEHASEYWSWDWNVRSRGRNNPKYRDNL